MLVRSTTCSALLEPNRAELGHKVAAPKNFYLAQTIALWSKLLQGFFKELYASGNDDHSFLQMCFFIVSNLIRVFVLFEHFRLYLKIWMKSHFQCKIHNFSHWVWHEVFDEGPVRKRAGLIMRESLGIQRSKRDWKRKEHKPGLLLLISQNGSYRVNNRGGCK